jgi:hypothetical protein
MEENTMKSKRKLAKELLKVVKNNGNYNPYDYWYQENEYVEIVTEKEVIDALINNVTRPGLKALQHEDTEIVLLGTYDASVCIVNDKLDTEIDLIYIGRTLDADTPIFEF